MNAFYIYINILALVQVYICNYFLYQWHGVIDVYMRSQRSTVVLCRMDGYSNLIKQVDDSVAET